MIAPNIKAPPHSNEAEQSLLGALMLDPGVWDRVADLVDESDFYRENHRLIFRGIAELSKQRQICDSVALTDWFSRQGMLDKVESGAYLTMLAGETPGTPNAKGYAEIVREKSRLRQLIQISTETQDMAMQGGDPGELADRLQRRISAWDEGTGSAGPKSIKEAAKDWTERLHLLESGDVEPVYTGLQDLDDKIGGLYPGDIHVIAARPAMGKSVLGLMVALHVAKRRLAFFYSGEMPNHQLINRMVQADGVPGEHLRDPSKMTKEDWQKAGSRIRSLTAYNLWLEDDPTMTVDTLWRTTRRMRPAILLVDYLQLMQATGRADNRTNEISEISRGLKRIAMDCDLPVLAISQLNRDLEKRPDKRPKLPDLRESGQLEQDAETVTFVYRDSEYHDIRSDVTELIVGKNRNGPRGTAYAVFEGDRVRFRPAEYFEINEYIQEINSGGVRKGPY